MKKQILKSIRRLWTAILVCIFIFSIGNSVEAEDIPLIYHHHVHSFNHSGCDHAIEMSASLVADAWTQSCVDDDPAYSELGIIVNSNAKEGPFRIYENGGGSNPLKVRYMWWFETEGSNLNAFAKRVGLTRVNGTRYIIQQADLDVMKNYCSAKIDTRPLTLYNITFDNLSTYFSTSWPTGTAPNREINLFLNLESRKAVNDFVYALTVNFPWSKYKVYFFDTVGVILEGSAWNRAWGGEGTYTNWKAGQLDMCKRVAEYARNKSLTGLDYELGVFANVFQLKRAWQWDYTGVWYANNDLRFDLYYYEKGTDNSGDYTKIGANGVVPGTTEPAYIDPDNPTTSYIPANLVALDNLYTGVGTFAHHLNACGTAGLQGSWFGWYGEDNTYSYPVDFKLLRALPNWDNLAGVAVPEYNNPQVGDERTWNGSVYWSTNSGASADVIYSKNPINGEFYIVFKTLNGIAYLPAGAIVSSGNFVAENFAKTTENALPALEIIKNQIRLKSGYSNKLNKGIRLTLESENVIIEPPSGFRVE